MEVLSNLKSNHYNHIKNIIRDSNEFHIVSPFLMESFDIFFHEIKKTKVEYISLTTTLKDNSLDLLKKANSLHSFCVNCIQNGIDYKIYIDNKLHGKIYIASQNGEPKSAIITSANFTDSGLAANHEWGVKIDNIEAIKNLINEVERSRSKNLSKEQITRIIEKIDEYSNSLQWETETKVDLKVSEFIEYKHNTAYSNKRFFIKPLGSAQEPFSTSRSLSSDVENIHFSKRRPASVRVGDILICYAVGSGKLLGLFEVIEEPRKSRIENDRWPWIVKAKNICVTYSESWYHYENTISSVQTSFKMDTAITYVGGKTLGALKYGADKIQLTEEFANHIIKIIKDTE